MLPWSLQSIDVFRTTEPKDDIREESYWTHQVKQEWSPTMLLQCTNQVQLKLKLKRPKTRNLLMHLCQCKW